jgi:antibiotic biosynthesis monooxygenase (ABM) superfamily enzyme
MRDAKLGPLATILVIIGVIAFAIMAYEVIPGVRRLVDFFLVP